MSGAKQIIVSRSYKPAPDSCAQAISLLLGKSAVKKASGAAGPDDAKETKNVRAAEKYTRST